MRELETRAERHSIARSLHDGYVQALAAVNLRLAGCRRLLERGQPESTAAELAELQKGVAREYDEVRGYIRSLVELDGARITSPDNTETTFHIQTDFRARGMKAEQILMILLEAVRNTMQHASADASVIQAGKDGGALRITIEDDGVGFPEGVSPPWSIASRVSELGGTMQISGGGRDGAHLTIELPPA